MDNYEKIIDINLKNYRYKFKNIISKIIIVMKLYK